MSASECMLFLSYSVLVVIFALDVVGVHLLSRQFYPVICCTGAETQYGERGCHRPCMSFRPGVEGPAAPILDGSSIDPTQAHPAKLDTAAGQQKGKAGALEADAPPLVVSARSFRHVHIDTSTTRLYRLCRRLLELWPGILGRG